MAEQVLKHYPRAADGPAPAEQLVWGIDEMAEVLMVGNDAKVDPGLVEREIRGTLTAADALALKRQRQRVRQRLSNLRNRMYRASGLAPGGPPPADAGTVNGSPAWHVDTVLVWAFGQGLVSPRRTVLLYERAAQLWADTQQQNTDALGRPEL
jgi:hypothetical protein